MKKNKQIRYYIAMTLSAIMIVNTMPIFAEEVMTEVSEYIHDENCNHIEGHPCIHEHTEECTTLICNDESEEHSHNDECFELNCTHFHNADCEYVEAIDCTCMKRDENNKENNCILDKDCILLAEHEGECVNKYADQSEISAKARSSVKAMQQAGILAGKEGNLYDPQGFVTRGQGAAMLHRMIEVLIDPTSANGWQKNDTGQKKVYVKGKAVTGWQTFDKLTYYFNENGEMYEGWKLNKDKWYYWNNDGAVIGWKFINGKWYYFENDGVMASNTWIEGYQLGEDGAMKTNH